MEEIAKMTVGSFQQMRNGRKFTAQAIETYLKQRKYHCSITETAYDGGARWPRKKFWTNVESDNPGIPGHFAYIKFYRAIMEEDAAEAPADDMIYALVAGKTKFGSTEIRFQTVEDKEYSVKRIDLERGNKAKRWLGGKETAGYQWCYEKVMIIWAPEAAELSDKEQENLAYSIEADVGGLFGLFSS